MPSALISAAATRRRPPVRRRPHPAPEIGEAVKALPAELLDTQPAIPWRQVARMRDHLAHRYYDTAHDIVQATVDHRHR